jgi:hypothetical protein
MRPPSNHTPYNHIVAPLAITTCLLGACAVMPVPTQLSLTEAPSRTTVGIASATAAQHSAGASLVPATASSRASVDAPWLEARPELYVRNFTFVPGTADVAFKVSHARDQDAAKWIGVPATGEANLWR